jgi:hypothetical protein
MKTKFIKPAGTVQMVMQDYATASCGWYSQLSGSPSSNDIANAILNIIYIPDICQ